MKVAELLQAAKTARPNLFAKVEDKKVVRMITAVLGEIAARVAATNEGKIDVSGLGRFVVKQGEVEKDGAKVKKTRVAFRPSKAKAKPAKAGKGGGAAKKAARAAKKAAAAG